MLKYNRDCHPQERWTKAELDQQMIALFNRMRMDRETVEWFKEAIRTRAHAAQDIAANRRKALHRQNANIDARLSRLMDMRLGKEITDVEYAAKRRSLQDEQSSVLSQLESLDRSNAETPI